jgi:lipopolysaccharide/colanic/teichoic acid biosynthesis glycosyltransferase
LKYIIIKSFLDKSVALIAIAALLPLLMSIFVLLLIHFKTNPIFIQIRPGYKGNLFGIYKFKTMKDAMQKSSIVLNDFERITKLGGVIRKLSLDELPQLFNVLFGQMSFVGPRPLLVDYLKIYTAEEMKRHDVKPGITGWAQVNGRNSISWKKKFNLDLWYVKNTSFLLDFKILFLTVLKVFKREDINTSDNKIMPHYNGKN